MWNSVRFASEKRKNLPKQKLTKHVWFFIIRRLNKRDKSTSLSLKEDDRNRWNQVQSLQGGHRNIPVYKEDCQAKETLSG